MSPYQSTTADTGVLTQHAFRRGPEDNSIYIDANTRIQILDTMVDLPTADKEQSAAFIVSVLRRVLIALLHVSAPTHCRGAAMVRRDMTSNPRKPGTGCVLLMSVPTLFARIPVAACAQVQVEGCIESESRALLCRVDLGACRARNCLTGLSRAQRSTPGSSTASGPCAALYCQSTLGARVAIMALESAFLLPRPHRRLVFARAR